MFAIIVQLEKRMIIMNEKINILDIELDNITAKEAMRRTMDFLQSEPTSIIGLLTASSLMYGAELEGYRDNVKKFDMLLAGDASVLEIAGMNEGAVLREMNEKLYQKMLFRYMNKQQNKVFLLVDKEEKYETLIKYLQTFCKNIIVSGSRIIKVSKMADDMIINEINGNEVDFVIAMIDSPIQEEFIIKNQKLIDTRIWLALGEDSLPVLTEKKRRFRFMEILKGRALKRENEKYKQSVWNERESFES